MCREKNHFFNSFPRDNKNYPFDQRLGRRNIVCTSIEVHVLFIRTMKEK